MDSQELAYRVRLHVLDMTSRGGSSHIGAAFSIVDILAVLYCDFLAIRPEDPAWSARDRFILSKGHAGAAVYATLAECGFFDISELERHYQNGSNLSGHISHKGVPGVELSTGSLGHGLGVGVGMALSAKYRNHSHRIVVLLSDGECDEGSNWESILFASHHRLKNLIAIVDYNKIQSLAPVSETVELEPFVAKWESFGWDAFEVEGHDHQGLAEVFDVAAASDGPAVVIAHTTKGKGVSFMENSVLWHYRCAKNEEYEAAKEELTIRDS